MRLKVWDKRKDAEQRCKWLKPRNPELKVGILAIDMDTVD